MFAKMFSITQILLKLSRVNLDVYLQNLVICQQVLNCMCAYNRPTSIIQHNMRLWNKYNKQIKVTIAICEPCTMFEEWILFTYSSKQGS